MQTNEPISNPEQTNTPPTTEIPTPPKKPVVSKSITSWLLLVLVVLLLGTSGLFTYKYYELKQQIDQQPTSSIPPAKVTTISPSPILSPTPTADPTADWKIYKNSKLSFKYPPSWVIQGEGVIASGEPDVHLFATEGGWLYNECMKRDSIEKKDDFVIRKFSRVTTGEMCSTNDGSPREQWVVLTEDSYGPGFSYTYSVNDNPEAEKNFDLILSTFRWVD